MASLAVATCARASALEPIGPAGVTPDGRAIRPAGFTLQVGSFASSLALSPDGDWLAVLSQDDGAIDLVDSHASKLVDRLFVSAATGMTWTADGLYVTGGYTGTVSRFTYDAKASNGRPAFVKRPDVQIGRVGLLNGIVEDPISHRIIVARTSEREVVVVDDVSGRTVATLKTTGQPFGVAQVGSHILATMYDSDHIDAWRDGTGDAMRIVTGPHPTAILADGDRAFVADADGNDVVEIDGRTLAVSRHVALGLSATSPPGQTPSGMVLSDDRKTLYVAESGLDDVAVVDLASGRVAARIPTGWYPMAIAFVRRSTVGKKDKRPRPQLWVASAKGLGAQANTGGEDNDAYTGLVQHLVVEPARFREWTALAARNEHPFRATASQTLPPIEHVVFIVKENKHFDEEFGDDAAANADPALLLYGRKFTPNAHALVDRYTLFDNFMGNGEASVYGHSWTTQSFANDYNERNAHSRSDSTESIARVAYSIWPYSLAGDDSLTASVMDGDWYRDLADLPQGPRMNTSAIFGPRGELIDELERRGKSFRVYGEQMTMLPSGAIAPGLAAHAARDYPGTHIDFQTLDTDRAKLFANDLAKHGLAQYTYLTLPTDHTAGADPGLYTPASYVSNNDEALGEIVAALSKRPEWRSTVVIVSTDDPSGTGDHVSSQRMPAYAFGPYVRRGFVDHTRYSIPSVLRTVEVAFGLAPLSIFDANATPMYAAFTKTPNVVSYTAIPSNIALVKNPGKAASLSVPIDGSDAERIPREEWLSLRGADSLAAHDFYIDQFLRADALALAGR